MNDKRIPSVRTRNRGRVGGLLDHIAKVFEEGNEGQTARWVYHPQHKPDLSNVVSKRADGYVEVKVEELGIEIPGLKGSDIVRVGDLVLMKIPTKLAEEFRQELAERAREQRDMLKREYYARTEEALAPSSEGGFHKISPRGDVRIEDKIFEVDREQRTS